MSYSKLFSSIVHSSLWTEEDHVRLLFVTLLAIADREGFVYGSRKGLMRMAHIRPEDHPRDPWDALMQPDPDSSDLTRNPENEGRRIEEIDGGFRILNFLYYRSLRNDDDRREQNREAQRRHREKVSNSQPLSSPNKPPSAKISRDQPTSEKCQLGQPISDADAEKSTPYPLKGVVFVKFCEWKSARRKMGGRIKDWDSMFQKQVKFLLKFSEAEQIEILEQSMRNGWVGLFPPNQSGSAVKPKQRAPSYPKLPPRIEQSEEDREKAAAIAKDEAEKFRQQYSA